MTDRLIIGAAFAACLALGPCLPAQINVPGDQPTIQAAVTAAAPGATIIVAAGTYNENVVVDKMLTIQGAMAGVDARGRVVGPPNPAAESVVTAAGGTLFQLVTGSAGTVIDGFAFVGGANAIASSSGPINGLQVLNNHVEGTSSSAIFLNDSGIDVTIHRNALRASAGTGGTLHCDTDNFDGLHLTENDVIRIGAPGGTGFFVDGNHNVGVSMSRAPLIQGNVVSNHNTGMNLGSRAFELGTISGNTFSGNAFDGLQGGIQSSAVTGNTFSNNGRSGLTLTSFGNMAADRGAQNLQITGNTFTGNGFGMSGEAVFFSAAQAPGTISTNHLNGNVIEGNLEGAFYAGTETIDAENNWWGDAGGPSGDGTGSGDVVNGMGGGGAIDFDPWLSCSPATPSWPVGSNPRDVALIDVAGGAALDVVTADSGTDTVTILTNDGMGGFGAPPITVALTPGDEPWAVAGGSLGGSALADVAVACRGGDVVRVLENLGGGAFAVSAIAAPAGTSRPVDVAVSDLDGAGTDDLVMTLEGDLFGGGAGGVAVSLNGGPAALLPAPVGGFLRAGRVACLDLDGDLDLDLAVTRKGLPGFPLAGSNVLLYENAGGAFTLAGALSAPLEAAGVCGDDLDEDGDVDLAVTVHSLPTLSSGGVVVFTNDGSAPLAPANFSASGIIPAGQFPDDVACADLLDDSVPGFIARNDVVTVNFGSGDSSRLQAYAGGAFESTGTCQLGVNPVAVAIGELNGDDTPDVVMAHFGSSAVSVELAVPKALAQPFGMGCPGTGGLTPAIGAVGLPTHGNPAFGVQVSDARPFAPALLGVSLGLLETPLGTGCTLYLAPEIITFMLFTDGTGTATFFFPVPPAVDPFRGLDVYFQFVIFDPAGTHLGFLAFSDALRTKFGS